MKRKQPDMTRDRDRRRDLAAGFLLGVAHVNKTVSQENKNFVRDFLGMKQHTVTNLLTATRRASDSTELMALIADKRHTNRGRPREYDEDEFVAKLVASPNKDRRTFSDAAMAVNMPRQTFMSYLRLANGSKRHDCVHPSLSNKHKLCRINFCLSHLSVASLARANPTQGLPTITNHDKGLSTTTVSFAGTRHIVHINETWINIKGVKQSTVQLPGEKKQYRTLQHKSHVPKVMALAAVAQPRGDFDGKLSFSFCVEYKTAKRKSKNRPAGSRVTTPVTMDKKLFVKMLTEEIMPAIHAKMPPSERDIVIQMDNAKPHNNVIKEPLVIAAIADMEKKGRNIELVFQPAQSPDLNVLDLAVFGSMKRSKLKVNEFTVDNVMKSMSAIFWDFPAQNLTNAFGTLQAVMAEILVQGGGNDYQLPHWHEKYHLPRDAEQVPLLEIEGNIVLDAISQTKSLAPN
jgi:hypothetical protein